MTNEALKWLLLNFFSIIVLAFYSMTEMACVSLNKVRLQYYLSKGNKRAQWLHYLLSNSSRLFGTTLIGVNIAMVYGSECARQFHQAIGLSPDLAPLSQVIIVVILGELAPMFAARHYSEHVAMIGAPILYSSARILAPFLWFVTLLSNFTNRLLTGKEEEAPLYITQEELKKMVEEQHEDTPYDTEMEDFNTITTRIFNLDKITVGEVMSPLKNIPKLPSNATVKNTRKLLARESVEYIPIYNRNAWNIVGIAFPRDIVRAPDTRRVRDYTRSPWFVTTTTDTMSILQQFRHNNQSVAVIIDEQGVSRGILTLDDLIMEIFGRAPYSKEDTPYLRRHRLMVIERTFPGDLKVRDFNKEYHMILSENEEMTLSQLMSHTLDHHPEVGETVTIGHFDLTAKETTLLGVKTVLIKTNL